MMIERRNLSEKRRRHARNTLHTYTRYIPMSPAYNAFHPFICLFIRMVRTARLISFPIDDLPEFCLDEFRNEEEDEPGRILVSDDRVP